MDLVTLGALFLAQVTFVWVVVQVVGGGSEVRILAVAVQALLLRELELRQWHEIALADRRDDLVEEIGHRLRVTSLTGDFGEIMIVGKEV
jgi:hypothetical protein